LLGGGGGDIFQYIGPWLQFLRRHCNNVAPLYVNGATLSSKCLLKLFSTFCQMLQRILNNQWLEGIRNPLKICNTVHSEDFVRGLPISCDDSLSQICQKVSDFAKRHLSRCLWIRAQQYCVAFRSATLRGKMYGAHVGVPEMAVIT
jgi:hypothetical protein